METGGSPERRVGAEGGGDQLELAETRAALPLETGESTPRSGERVEAALDPHLQNAVLAGLFSHRRQALSRATIGRYTPLRRIGAGGMGVVYAAHDPELDRAVALKLLHPRRELDAGGTELEAARSRLLREAQALAKLNHPHIVAIHDVGEHEGSVWLAMEYVAGETLTAWLRRRRRSWREVLDVMIPVARGLAAAHEAGLVHRDIKPDNIMIGDDGRARVMDLGLARVLDADPESLPGDATSASAVEVTRTGAVLGTPAYMSPEQFAGAPADARADVFSYCVTLWEALMGARPFAGATLPELATSVCAGDIRKVPRDRYARRVPGWLRELCVRGLAVDPGRRPPSMGALLEALLRGRARARTRRWLLAGMVVVGTAGAAEAGRRYELAQRHAACAREGGRALAVLDASARARVREGLRATGATHASETAERALPLLEAQAAAWTRRSREVCEAATIEETLDATRYGRARWCLEERLLELETLIDQLAQADEKMALRAVHASAGLQRVSPCADASVLAALPDPPREDERARAVAIVNRLARARTMEFAGKYREGLAVVQAARAEAEVCGWPPLLAIVQQLEGKLLRRTHAFADAERVSAAAYVDATKARAWAVAAAAADELTITVGSEQARFTEGELWSLNAEMAGFFAGDPLGLLAARRKNALAVVYNKQGARAKSRTLHEETLELRERALGPEHPHVAISLNNLATDYQREGANAEARALYERALAIKEKTLGPEHPQVASSLNNLAIAVQASGAHEEAIALLERALTIRREALGSEHPKVARNLANLGLIHSTLGRHAEAARLLEQALEVMASAYGPAHPIVAQTLNNLALVHNRLGEAGRAASLLERALRIQEEALGPAHLDVAQTLMNLGAARMELGELAEAVAPLQRSLNLRREALGPEHPDVASSLSTLGELELRRGRADAALALLEEAAALFAKHEGVQENELASRMFLARALIATGGDEARALAEARAVERGYRETGEGLADRAAVEAFIKAREAGLARR